MLTWRLGKADRGVLLRTFIAELVANFLQLAALIKKKEFQDDKLAVEPDPTKALIMGSRDS
jgi:hypothetical protein